MGFLFPQMFWLLLAVIPVVIVWSFLERGRASLLNRFVVRENWELLNRNVSKRARFHKGLLLILALVLSIVAAARPWYGSEERALRSRGVNILFAIDVSESMMARDVGAITSSSGSGEMPSRLEYARGLVRQILLGIPGHRVGVMPFAGEAFLQCPLTSDYGVVQDVVRQLGHQAISLQGTEIPAMIDTAIEAFERSGDGTRVLIVLTDGEDHTEALRQAADKAATKDVTIFALGIGSPEGAPIIRPDGNYLQDRDGIKVLSKVNPAVLRDLAVATGGRAYLSTTGGRLDPDPLIAQLDLMTRDDFGEQQRVVRHERYQWPLGLALLCLILEAFLRERRAEPAQKVRRGKVVTP